MLAEIIVVAVTSTVLGSLWLTNRVMHHQRIADRADDLDPNLAARLEKLQKDRIVHERLAHDYRVKGFTLLAITQDRFARETERERDRLIKRGYL